MYITPERCKQVLFTDPHYRLLDTLLVAQGNPKELRSYEDIAGNPEVKIAIMSGTVNLGYARKAGIKDSQILQVPDTTSQLQAVRSGRADAAIGTQLTMRGLAAGPVTMSRPLPTSRTIPRAPAMVRWPSARRTKPCAMQ